MKDVKIISLDGLNRSGKGTQLSMLKKNLESEAFSVKTIRGDGSREGVGNPEYHDPYSPWWKRWQDNKQKTPQDWDNAYLVLNKELEEEVSHFGQANKAGFILLDRCYISRWFVERQREGSIPFEDVIDRTYVFPHKYFILEAPKDVLLSRQNDDNPKKAKFRRQIVNQWYDLWVDTINKVEERFNDKMVRLDATQSKEDINKQILQNINLYK